MIIHDLRLSRENDSVQTLAAIATFETPQPRSFRVFFRFENAPGEVALTADPFLVGFLTPAMLLNEPLEVRGPVDPELLASIREDVVPLLLRWYRSLHKIDLICEEREPPAREGPGKTIQAWSGGLDATYTAVKNLGEIDAFMTSQGFDSRTYHPEFWNRIVEDIRAAADNLGKPLFVVNTNLREVSHYQAIQTRKGRIDPDYYELGHNGPIGNYLVAIARGMLPFASRFIISANIPYEKLFPYGCHPLLDPKWSTPRLKVLHDGCEAGRVDKVEFIKRVRPEALKTLRVCWFPEYGEINCGRCEKCIRTMCELRAAGAEDLGAPFARPIDFRAIRRLKLDSHHQFLWEQIRDAAVSRGDTELARAAAAAARRPFRLPLPQSRARREREEKRVAREFWKHARKVMKPPPEASGEVPTPDNILADIAKR